MIDYDDSVTKTSISSSGRLERLSQAALRERARRHPDNLLFWSEAYRRIAEGPFVVPPALRAIYQDDHPFIVIRKPRQVGATEFNLNPAAGAADRRYAERGVVLYMLPTGEMADRISQTRMSKVVQESPYLRRRAVPEPGIARGPANIRRRTIGPGVVYFCGSEEETQYSGIDADVVILDESDLMQEEVLSLVQARLRSSRSRRLRVTSTPTISDFGVSHLFEMSDQGYYELACRQCSAWQEPQFPDSVDWDAFRVVCLDCRAPLDPWQEGRWVFRQPAASEIRGYQLNRLTLPDPPLHDMKLALDGKVPTGKETFYRQDLGQPFTSPESRLTPDILDSCIEPWRPQLLLKMYVMGIDVGSKLHVVIRGRFKGKWYLFEAFTANSFEELDPCFTCYNIACCVVDAFPETREARRFQEAHYGTVWLAQYTQQGLEPEWSYDSWLVRAPRTPILDEMLHQFREHVYVLPTDIRAIEDGQYFRQLQAPVRTTELDGWGHPVAIYRHREPDDFAHAEVYATLATIRATLDQGEVFALGYEPGGWEVIRFPHNDYAD
jgi:hypothetical protein